jgi:hypothetical protein
MAPILRTAIPPDSLAKLVDGYEPARVDCETHQQRPHSRSADT